MAQPKKKPVSPDKYFAMEEVSEYNSLNDICKIKSIDIELSLDTIYDRVKLSNAGMELVCSLYLHWSP